jgi:hypothetical protein
VTPWPSIWNRTPVTVGNCVSVYTTCAIRAGIVDGPAPDSKAELRSAVAIPALTLRPSSAVPAGICERSAAAYSAAEGPASRRSTAARPAPGVAGTVRPVTNSLPCWVNHT